MIQSVDRLQVRDDQVIDSALQNAASIASLLLTTEAVISVIPEQPHRGAPAMGGMSDDMY